MLTKFTLLIPLKYGDGTRVPRSVLVGIYDELYSLSDGYTLAATVTGAYRMKHGAKQVDKSIEVWVCIKPSQENALRQLAAEICRQLDQEVIYLERTGATVDFVPPCDSGE